MMWDGPGGPLQIDVAGGTYGRLQRAGIDPQKLSGVLLTHSHADHIYGFPLLLLQRRDLTSEGVAR
jgi:ribonuclease Z